MRTVTYYTVGNHDLNLTHTPVNEDDILFHQKGDKLLVAYLSDDSDIENPLENDEAYGHIYTARRGDRKGNAGMQEALGLDSHWIRDHELIPNPHAVMLDCYEHGGVIWSVSGGGMQCQFDTARGAGVWVPNEVCLDEIKAGKTPVELAKQALEQYNAWLNGEGYGCVVEVFEIAGELDPVQIEEDACWGYLGRDYAAQTLKDEYFEPKVKEMEAEHA